MVIKKTLGMTLKEFVEEKGASQVTVQHAIDKRITHVKGFDNHKDYKLIEGHTLWYKVGDKLIKDTFKKKSDVIQRITNVIKPKINKRK